MELTSPAFATDSDLSQDATCKGRGINPSLVISGVPASAKSLVLVMHDPNAVGGQDFLHWLVWNIPPNTTQIAEGAAPAGAIQGVNDYPRPGYGPACPPAGTGVHHYIFELYALDTTLNLSADANRQTVEQALQPHVLATAKLVGLVDAGSA